jgi:lipopolysaccharide export system protein LptA
MKLTLALFLLFSAALPAQAERADRLKPLTIQADTEGQLDLQHQVVVFKGNVVVSKGTLEIRAARIEVRQTGKGYDTALALGAPGKPATFRQKRDGLDEYIDGHADRLEYDGKTDHIKFIKNAVVRRLRGSSANAAVADEMTGSVIAYDGASDVLRVSGSPGNSASGGRVRVVLAPSESPEPVAAPAPASVTASQPRSQP